MAEIRLAYSFCSFLSLQNCPVCNEFGHDAAFSTMKLIVFIQFHTVPAISASHSVALTVHLILGAAFGTQVKKRIQFFCHLSIAIKSNMGFLIPEIIVMG